MLYLAATPGIKSREIKWQKIMKSRLLSFWDIRIETHRAGDFAFNLIKMEKTENNIELFLDSGAYSAWSQDKEIDIYEYIDFIKEHEQVIDVYANLDVISAEKIGNKKSAQSTLKNQRIMEEAGLSPLPVFHFGEPMEFLQGYLNEYDYISLGGMVPISNNNLIPWLDNLFFEHLTDAEGIPKVKIHGFGLTSLKLMLRYPWYSVDSTTWSVGGRNGEIYVPRYKEGEWVYDKNPWKIAVSSRSPKRKKFGKHIETLSPRQKSTILNYIHKKGFELGESKFVKKHFKYQPQENERWAESREEMKGSERLLEIIEKPGLSNKYQLRDELNIIYYLDLEQTLPEWPWAFKRKGIKRLI